MKDFRILNTLDVFSSHRLFYLDWTKYDEFEIHAIDTVGMLSYLESNYNTNRLIPESSLSLILNTSEYDIIYLFNLKMLLTIPGFECIHQNNITRKYGKLPLHIITCKRIKSWDYITKALEEIRESYNTNKKKYSSEYSNDINHKNHTYLESKPETIYQIHRLVSRIVTEDVQLYKKLTITIDNAYKILQEVNTYKRFEDIVNLPTTGFSKWRFIPSVTHIFHMINTTSDSWKISKTSHNGFQSTLEFINTDWSDTNDGQLLNEAKGY